MTDCNFIPCGAKLAGVYQREEKMAKYSDFFTYCVFGFLATLVNMGTYHLLYDTASLSNVAATVLAWFTAVTFYKNAQQESSLLSRCEMNC